MPNVRLRTIINQDNSTTFQVQFHEGGEWEDLTWDMISDKPFETLDDTVFMVDENGVLTITDIHTVSNWTDIEDKPFIFLDPDDFTVSASGVLSYTGSLDWSSIIGKPFNTLNNNDFEVQNGQLSVKHQIIPNQSWSQIQNKPFTSLDPTNFQVVGGVLYLNINPEIPYWSAIQNKPFTYLDSDDFAVIGDTLKVKHQTIPDPEWVDVQNKPFESLDANDFTVDAQGKMSVNFPTPTPDDWDDITNKPFETLNGTDFSVDADGEVSVNFPAPTADEWDDVANKPFESLNPADFSVDDDGEASVNFPVPFWSDVLNKPFELLSAQDFNVDPDTGILSINGGGGGGNPDWSDVQNKPFSTLDSPLFGVYNGGLRLYPAAWLDLAMPNQADAKISTLNDLKKFIQIFIVNTLKFKFNLSTPTTGWYSPMYDDNKQINIRLRIRIDNSQSDLTVLTSDYYITISFVGYRLYNYNPQDIYFFKVEVDGMPAIINSVEKFIKINGTLKVSAIKTDGEITDVQTSNTYYKEDYNMFWNECTPYLNL